MNGPAADVTYDTVVHLRPMTEQASELLTVMSTAYLFCSPCAGRPRSRVAGSRQHVCGRFGSRRCADVCAAAFAGLDRPDDVVPGVGDDGMVRIVVTDVGGADRLRDDPAECGRGAGPAEHTNRSVPRHRIITVQGDTRDVVVIGERFYDNSGEVVGTPGFYIDVTPTAQARESSISAALAEISDHRAAIEQPRAC